MGQGQGKSLEQDLAKSGFQSIGSKMGQGAEPRLGEGMRDEVYVD